MGKEDLLFRRILALWLVTALVGTWGTAASVVRAEPTNQGSLGAPEAAVMAQEGADAYENGRYQEAAEKLKRAYPLLPVPTVGLYLARALEKGGYLVEAFTIYDEVQGLSPDVGERQVQKKAQADAAQEQALLVPRIPQMNLRLQGVTPEQVRIAVDGVGVSRADFVKPQRLNPGRHLIEAHCEGRPSNRQTVELTEGQVREVTVEFAAPQAPVVSSLPARRTPTPRVRPDARNTPYDLWHPLPLAALGVGAAAAVAGGITGTLALAQRAELDDDGCVNQHCPIAREDDVARLNGLRTASTAAFILGGVGLATGATLVLVPLRRAEQSGMTAWVSPTMAGVRGVFQ